MPRKKTYRKRKMSKSGGEKTSRRWELFRIAKERGLKVETSTPLEKLEKMVCGVKPVKRVEAKTLRKTGRKRKARRSAAPRKAKAIEQIKEMEKGIDLTYARLYKLAERFGHAMGRAFGEGMSLRLDPKKEPEKVLVPVPVAPIVVPPAEPTRTVDVTWTANGTGYSGQVLTDQSQVVQDVQAAVVQPVAPESVPPDFGLDLTEPNQCSVDCGNHV